MTGVLVATALLLAAPSLSLAEFDQRVPARVCGFAADTGACFEPENRTYRVGKEVSSLGDLYHFCVGLDSTLHYVQPMSIVLSMDFSCSMCWCDSANSTKNGPNLKNDTDDVRIEAIYALLDTLNRRSPQTKVGIVKFYEIVAVEQNPLIVGSRLSTLISEVFRNSCEALDPSRYTGPSHHPSLRKIQGVEAGTGAKWTDQGGGIIEALKMVNANNTDASGDTLPRHVILLTDGGWQDEGSKPYKDADSVLAWYAATYPNLSLPKIHTVLLMRNPTVAGGGDTVNIAKIASVSGGQYIPDASPATIVRNLLSIIDSISIDIPEVLEQVTFTNLDDPSKTANGTPEKYVGSDFDYRVIMPDDLPLDIGLNRIQIRKTISGNILYDTLLIQRETVHIDNPDIGSWKQVCGIDTMHMDILGIPSVAETASRISVTAKVRPEEANDFAPDSVLVRAITGFSVSDPATVGLFHFEGSLANAGGAMVASGAPQFTKTDFAFGEQALNAGQTFTLDFVGSISGDFTVEAWVKPQYGSTSSILSGRSVAFGIDAQGRLYYGSLVSSWVLDAGVWQHVAVARSGGETVLYVNGIRIASTSQGVITPSGVLTVGPVSGPLDELRVRTIVKTTTVAGVKMLELPTAGSMSWDRGTGPVTAATVTIPAAAWQSGTAGQTSLTVGAAQHTQFFVNLLHPSQGLEWSKMSNPLLIYKKYAMLVIESEPDGASSPYSPRPIETLQITDLETEKSAYAVIRDSRGYFVESSPATTWLSADPTVVTVAPGDQTKGEGVFTKTGADRSTTVTATSVDHPTLSATIPVKVLGYYWERLQIVTAIGRDSIDTLAMTTDDDTTLLVLGLRSHDKTWEVAEGNWYAVAVNPPTQALVGPSGERWVIELDGGDTGTGWIRVRSEDDSLTKPDSIWYHFTPAGPSNISLDIITPDSLRIAGDTLTAVVRINNTDGPVPGTWCGTSVFADKLGNGGRTDPIIIVDGNTQNLNVGGASAVTSPECFSEGVDTVKLVLYYAPYASDSLHQISVSLSGLNAVAKPFRLLPGPIAQLRLENSLGAPLPDTVRLAAPDGAVSIYTTGYDVYGNKIGLERSDWSRDGTLHRIGTDSTSSIYYSSTHVRYDEEGRITAASLTDPSVTGSLYMIIDGPPAILIASFTRDTSGNGYLDAVDLVFDKEIVIPDSSSFRLNNLTVHYFDEYFTIEDIYPLSGDSADTHWRLVLRERDSQRSPGPQTGWDQLMVDLGGIPETRDTVGVTVSDGAGPVVWSVTVFVNSASDRTKDRVEVTLSEDILNANGAPFSLANLPADVFTVWLDSSGVLVRRDSILNGITGFTQKDGRKVVFTMSNGVELTGDYLFSLKSESAVLADYNAKNGPVADNQQVRLNVRGAVGGLKVGPLPLSPTVFIPAAEGGGAGKQHELKAYLREEVSSFVQQYGGVMITVSEFVLSQDKKMPAEAVLMVFDAVGNPVFSLSSKDVIPDRWRDHWVPGSKQEFNFYWNGTTDRGVIAAPGVYRLIIIFKYAGAEGDKLQYRENIGVMR